MTIDVESQVTNAVYQTAALEVGALGLGAVLTLTMLDVSGLEQPHPLLSYHLRKVWWASLHWPLLGCAFCRTEGAN